MPTTDPISAYIRNEPPVAKKRLQRVRSLIAKTVPEATEKLAWGMPTFHLDGNLLHFAAFQNHLSLFPGTDAILHFKKQLTGYVTSKGTIQIPYESEIPATLLLQIVKYCVRRNRADAKRKLAKKAARKKSPRKPTKGRR